MQASAVVKPQLTLRLGREASQAHESVGEKRDGPPCPPGRGLTASNLNQPGLRGPVEFVRTGGFVLGFALQTRFDPTLAAAIAYALHRHEPGLQVVGDLLVGRPLVGLTAECWPAAFSARRRGLASPAASALPALPPSGSRCTAFSSLRWNTSGAEWKAKPSPQWVRGTSARRAAARWRSCGRSRPA